VRASIAVGGLVLATALVVVLEVGGAHSRHHASGPTAVAGRFAVALAGWDGIGAAARFANLVTPALLDRLAAPAATSAPAPTSVVLHSVTEEDVGSNEAGVAASVAVDGTFRTVDIHLVRTPSGWRVDAVEP
jgi:hypothetical protein